MAGISIRIIPVIQNALFIGKMDTILGCYPDRIGLSSGVGIVMVTRLLYISGIIDDHGVVVD